MPDCTNSLLLQVGADPFPPYQYYDASGCLRGSDYDMVRRALEHAEFQPEFCIDEWPRVEAAFRAGRLDAVFQVQKTPEREALYSFSVLLREAATDVTTARDELVAATWDDLASLHRGVGMMGGYAYGGGADALPETCRRVFDTQEALLRAVSDGEVAAAVFDAGVCSHLAENMGISNLRTIPALRFFRPLYVVFQDSRVCEAFNRSLEILRGVAVCCA